MESCRVWYGLPCFSCLTYLTVWAYIHSIHMSTTYIHVYIHTARHGANTVLCTSMYKAQICTEDRSNQCPDLDDML